MAVRRERRRGAALAIAMMLIQTAKLNGVNPQVYLTDVLQRVVSGQTRATELDTLQPWN